MPTQRVGAAVDESTVGRTPLVELDLDVAPTVSAKVEWFNLYDLPHGGGSVKSRIARAMLDAAEAAGEIGDRTIIEPSSGNTGSEVARIGAARGYDVEIVMPDNAAAGKIEAVRDAGAEIHFVDADEGYDAVIERCESLVAADPDAYYRPDQYTNPANPGAHERTTAPEIWDQTAGAVTHFVAGVGTGGTITGTGRGLQDRGDVTVVGFEPAEPLHAIDGLKFLRSGDHYHPETYDESVLDEKVYVDTGAAYEHARALREQYADREVPVVDPGQHAPEVVREHLRVDTAAAAGEFLVGTSSGAAVEAVHELDRQGRLDADDHVVIVLCDRGDKYADIPLWRERFDG
ncbi:MAG: PLP-dependent cysteine synthase family protein [Halobacteriaceae archaeon]